MGDSQHRGLDQFRRFGLGPRRSDHPGDTPSKILGEMGENNGQSRQNDGQAKFQPIYYQQARSQNP
jgi:hypothetical protein